MVTWINPAKMAEPIEMPFVGQTQETVIRWGYVSAPPGEYD